MAERGGFTGTCWGWAPGESGLAGLEQSEGGVLDGLAAVVAPSCRAGDGAGVELALTDWMAAWGLGGLGAVGGGAGLGDTGGGVPWTRFTSAERRERGGRVGGPASIQGRPHPGGWWGTYLGCQGLGWAPFWGWVLVAQGPSGAVASTRAWGTPVA